MIFKASTVYNVIVNKILRCEAKLLFPAAKGKYLKVKVNCKRYIYRGT